MTQDEATKSLRDVWKAMEARFPKAYSRDRLEQLRQCLSHAEMAVTHLHDEEMREEHDERQAGQIRKMLHGSRDHEGMPLLTEGEARTRVVENGERV